MNLGSRPVCQHSIVNAATSGTLAIPGATAGAFPTQRIAVFAMVITVGGATLVTLQDTAANALSSPFDFLAAALPLSIEMHASFEPRWITSGPGIGIQLNNSNAVQCSADIWWLPVT